VFHFVTATTTKSTNIGTFPLSSHDAVLLFESAPDHHTATSRRHPYPGRPFAGWPRYTAGLLFAASPRAPLIICAISKRATPKVREAFSTSGALHHSHQYPVLDAPYPPATQWLIWRLLSSPLYGDVFSQYHAVCTICAVFWISHWLLDVLRPRVSLRILLPFTGAMFRPAWRVMANARIPWRIPAAGRTLRFDKQWCCRSEQSFKHTPLIVLFHHLLLAFQHSTPRLRVPERRADFAMPSATSP